MNRIFTILLMVAAFSLLPSVTSAAVETLTAKADYLLPDTMYIKDGQKIAFDEAMRRLSEQVGLIIEAKSRSTDNQLTADEVILITSNLVQVKSKEYNKSLDQNGKITVYVTVVGEYDTDTADKRVEEVREARKAAVGYDKLRQEYANVEGQMAAMMSESTEKRAASSRHFIREGQKLERTGDLAGAMENYEKAVRLAPNYARPYSRRGHIYRKQGKEDLALNEYVKAAAIDPKEPGAHLGKAIILDRQGKNLEAVEEYRSFIQNADIMEYDKEISEALDRMIVLFDGV